MTLLILFALVGIFAPTNWHKKFTLSERKWNIALLIICIIVAIASSGGDEVSAQNNQKVQQELDRTKKQLEDSNKKIAQLTETNTKLTAQLQPYLDAEKKKQEELARLEAEKKAAEEKKRQEALSKKTTTSTTTNKSSTRRTTSSKPTYRGTSVTCSSFSSSAEATAYMKAYGVYKLDRDKDGIACESL